MSQSDDALRPVKDARLSFFFFNYTATPEIYPLSLHDALPISGYYQLTLDPGDYLVGARAPNHALDRKSTRLNSSHGSISYAVFCLNKKHNRVGPVRTPPCTTLALYVPVEIDT